MPRNARIILPDVPHHITHRGKGKQIIFIDDNDRLDYLHILKQSLETKRVVIYGYCLMLNHIHLLVTPTDERAFSKFIGFSHRLYSQRFNIRHGRTGKLFENRYFSYPLDEAHLQEALIYVDQNPVRAGLVELPWEYEWSSARAHKGEVDRAKLIDPKVWKKIADQFDYETIVRQKIDGQVINNIRKHTLSGKLMGEI